MNSEISARHRVLGLPDFLESILSSVDREELGRCLRVSSLWYVEATKIAWRECSTALIHDRRVLMPTLKQLTSLPTPDRMQYYADHVLFLDCDHELDRDLIDDGVIYNNAWFYNTLLRNGIKFPNLRCATVTDRDVALGTFGIMSILNDKASYKIPASRHLETLNILPNVQRDRDIRLARPKLEVFINSFQYLTNLCLLDHPLLWNKAIHNAAAAGPAKLRQLHIPEIRLDWLNGLDPSQPRFQYVAVLWTRSTMKGLDWVIENLRELESLNMVVLDDPEGELDVAKYKRHGLELGLAYCSTAGHCTYYDV